MGSTRIHIYEVPTQKGEDRIPIFNGYTEPSGVSFCLQRMGDSPPFHVRVR